MNKKGSACFIASHGMAGDLLFDWLPKALQLHPEIYIYMGESIRSKYLKERTRKERPDPLQFKKFLLDMCSDNYLLAGECFSYRTFHFRNLPKSFFKDCKVVNIVRDPIIWLHHYSQWRVNNCNMPTTNTFATDWEWKITKHDKFKKLGLKKYQKKDVNIWSFFQGLDILTRMQSDIDDGFLCIKLEDLSKSLTNINKLLSYLSNGKIKFSSSYQDLIFSLQKEKRRKWHRLYLTHDEIVSEWKSWQKDAYEIILSPKYKKVFNKHGYILP